MSVTARIEGPGRYSRMFALRVHRSTGPRLFDFECVHFSTARTRATLAKRLARLFPGAVLQK